MSMRSRFDQWRLYSDRLIQTARGNNRELRDYETNLQGKQLMDSIRSESDAFVATEQGLRAQRLRTARKLVEAGGPSSAYC